MKIRYAIIDLETTGLRWTHDEITLNGIAYATEDEITHYNVLIKPESVKKHIEHIREAGLRTIFQNGKFDTLFWYEEFGMIVPIHEDVMLMGTAYDLAAPHGLKEMSMNWLKVPNWDISTKDKKSDTPQTRQYLKYDLQYTWELYKWLDARLDERQRMLYKKLLLPSVRMYRKAEKNGIYVIPEQYLAVKKHYAAEQVRTKKELDKLASINWNSAPQVQKYLFETTKHPIISCSARTGEPSASAKVLKRLAYQGFPIPQKLLDYKEFYGANTKFLNSWSDFLAYDGRLHPSFKLYSVVTGRTSCSLPNLQQVPRKKDIRSLFSAPPGKTLISADYSQVELRIAAHYSKDPAMLKIYREGGDIHLETARQIVGRQDITDEERSRAKPVNFGYIYKMSANTLVPYAFDNYGVIMTKEEAHQYHTRYFEKFWRLPEWHKEQEELCKALGGISTLFGRFRKLPDIYSKDGKNYHGAVRRAINTPVQSTASDILLSACIEVNNMLPWINIVGTIHDSILMEVENERVDEAVEMIRPIMVQPKLLDTFNVRLRVPLEVDIKVGKW